MDDAGVEDAGGPLKLEFAAERELADKLVLMLKEGCNGSTLPCWLAPFSGQSFSA